MLTARPLDPRRCDVYSPDEGTMAMSNHGVPAEEGAPGFPALPEGKRVGVLMIHGGAWMLGEKEQLEMWARGMAKKGYVCVLNGYRLALPPDQRTAISLANGMDDAGGVSEDNWAAEFGQWPTMIHDCKAAGEHAARHGRLQASIPTGFLTPACVAVRWMRASADELGISAEHIAVTGNSAGGHLSLLVAGVDGELYPELEGEGGNPGVSSKVQACCAVYPPTTTRAPPFVQAPGSNERDAASFTPFQYASEHFPPTCFIHGNGDTLVPQAESFKMYDELLSRGAHAEMHVGAATTASAGSVSGRQCPDSDRERWLADVRQHATRLRL